MKRSLLNLKFEEVSGTKSLQDSCLQKTGWININDTLEVIFRKGLFLEKFFIAVFDNEENLKQLETISMLLKTVTTNTPWACLWGQAY